MKYEVPSGADFSACRTWRYELWRIWDDKAPALCVIGLNPSTADETEDDPTIRRLIGFAKREGYGRLRMFNLFAYRATQPKVMKLHDDPVGPANNAALVDRTDGLDVLCAWGGHGGFLHRGRRVLCLFAEYGTRRLFHLGLTVDGHPKHPLYLRRDTPFVEWVAPLLPD